MDEQLVSAPPTPSSTQLPTTSFKSQLLNYGISSEEIERLLSTYNRQKIAIMDDQFFCKWLLEDVAKSGLVDESKMDLRMREERSRIEQDCVSAKIHISLAGVDFLHTDEQRDNLIASIQGSTIHGYQILLETVSFLIETTAQSPLHLALQTTKITGVRRSKRISHKPQRRSARIEKQKKTNVTSKKNHVIPAGRLPHH